LSVPTAVDLDLQAVRQQFPSLALQVDGRPVVYLDNPAGTQVPQRVIDAIVGNERRVDGDLTREPRGTHDVERAAQTVHRTDGVLTE